ncbi:winged helix DNA-binding domain-containing protein [Paenibacillus sp. HJGM_3]|uniref:winged helix DNA-binding domain-containing protein n=1 Tax=Paenibacillus sp. HJGM_3 TaxID=3379816 RepID=UPI00385CFA29
MDSKTLAGVDAGISGYGGNGEYDGYGRNGRLVGGDGPLEPTREGARVLGRRALNRALLARQLLLERSTLPTLEALEHLVGLQAQAPHPPYYGLWARLAGFRQESLANCMLERSAVRLSLMRSTIHLVSARDGSALRPLLQSVHERGLNGAYGRQLAGLDMDALAGEGRALVEAQPLTLGELGKRMRERWPDRDAHALAMAVRTAVPLVQVPPRGIWGQSGQAAHTTAEAWLGRTETPAELEELVLRYLGAFGPATVKDMQVWSGLTRLREAFEPLRDRLLVFQDEQGNELFDLPDAPRPDPDTPAPPRFLGEFDNMLLSFDDRSRIMAEADKPRVFTENGIIRATILVDGFVRGLWRLEAKRKAAVLEVEPFTPLSEEDRQAIADEGERLLEFAASQTSPDQRTVRFVDPGC